MKPAFFSILWAVSAYFVGLFACIVLVPVFSQNKHDVQLEAVMTGAFVIGPLLAILTFAGALAFFLSRRK
jgi:nitrate reductase gamma subunit